VAQWDLICFKKFTNLLQINPITSWYGVFCLKSSIFALFVFFSSTFLQLVSSLSHFGFLVLFTRFWSCNLLKLLKVTWNKPQYILRISYIFLSSVPHRGTMWCWSYLKITQICFKLISWHYETMLSIVVRWYLCFFFIFVLFWIISHLLLLLQVTSIL
jgi:hypothetical protein